MDHRKTTLGLSAALLATTTLASPSDAGMIVDSPLDIRGASSSFILAAGEGGEAGESAEAGEAGEKSEASAGEAGESGHGGGDDDAGYLMQLGLIRGHIDVGVALYEAGQRDAAITHMKHPGDEIYADLVPLLEAEGAEGFDDELANLADAVEGDLGMEAVRSAHVALSDAIDAAEAFETPSAGEMAGVILELVRTSAMEYDAAIENEAIISAHEYQDALGFYRVASAWLGRLRQSNADPSVCDEIGRQLNLMGAAWPTIMAPDRPVVEPSVLFGAAARIEIAALSLS